MAPKRVRRSIIPELANESWVDYCRFPGAMVAGNHVELLVDGAMAYPSMLQAISEARATILMASYIFHDDQAGYMFADALVEKVREGVSVYLIVDGVGTFNVPRNFFDDLVMQGIQVLVYRSPSPWRKSSGLLRRDHRKLLVVDGAIGFAGGLNIGAEWLPKDIGGGGWHDIHMRVEGPAVRELSKLAIATWKGQGGVNLDQRVFLPPVAPSGDQYVSIVGSMERKKRHGIRQSYLQAIRQAREYIYIANAYFLPERGFRRALRNACKRGVDVRVMVPKRGDILAFQLASQALYGRLLRAGIRVFLWEDAVLHAKTAVIDNEWATVGSFNIDHRSWTMNLEVNVNAVGAELCKQIKELFLEDQKHCRELKGDFWVQRPLIQKFFEWFFYQFRRFM